jgi:hypothetical protein
MLSLVCLTGVLVFGTESASAVDLCKAPENPNCLSTKKYTIGTQFELEAKNTGSILFKVVGVSEIACTGSSFRLKLTVAGIPLQSEITNMVFSGCKEGKTSCTVETRNQPLLADIYKYNAVSYAGKVVLVPRMGANPSWKLTCTGGIDCIYGDSEEIVGMLDDGAAPLFEIIEKKLELEQGAPCPGEAEIFVAYKFKTGPIYVTD